MDTLTYLKENSVQNIHLLVVLYHQKYIKHRGAQIMRVTSLWCKGVPKDVTQCIIGGQQILDGASDKRLLLLVSKCNLIFVSVGLRHPLEIWMRLSVELVRNDLSKLGKRSRTDRSARHPTHSTSIIIHEEDSGIELHD